MHGTGIIIDIAPPVRIALKGKEAVYDITTDANAILRYAAVVGIGQEAAITDFV